VATQTAGRYLPPVSDFLDVPGASGARYRFRRVRLTELPVTAGNVVAFGANGRRALLCATARGLARAAGPLREALRAHRGVRLYIRLNVAREVREAEHADIAAALNPQSVLPEIE
jgi:hypothetical protein